MEDLDPERPLACKRPLRCSSCMKDKKKKWHWLLWMIQNIDAAFILICLVDTNSWITDTHSNLIPQCYRHTMGNLKLVRDPTPLLYWLSSLIPWLFLLSIPFSNWSNYFLHCLSNFVIVRILSLYIDKTPQRRKAFPQDFLTQHRI